MSGSGAPRCARPRASGRAEALDGSSAFASRLSKRETTFENHRGANARNRRGEAAYGQSVLITWPNESVSRTRFDLHESFETASRSTRKASPWVTRPARSIEDGTRDRAGSFSTAATCDLFNNVFRRSNAPTTRTTPRASPEPQIRTKMSAVSFRSAVATGLVAKPAARDVKARAGLKVYARMTKDRVSLKKDSKWRSDIDIYPVRPRRRPSRLSLTRRSLGRRAHAPHAGAALAPAAGPPQRARCARASRPPRKKARNGGRAPLRRQSGCADFFRRTLRRRVR